MTKPRPTVGAGNEIFGSGRVFGGFVGGWLLMAVLSLSGICTVDSYADNPSVNVPPPPVLMKRPSLPPGREYLTNTPVRPVKDPATNREFNDRLAGSALDAANLNPQGALTNRPDFVGATLTRSVARYEQELTNPGLDPVLRKSYERLLDQRKGQLADHETNLQLWTSLHRAHESRDVEKAATAERELANYLSRRLGTIQGKTYPTGMSLEAIATEYAKASGGRMTRLEFALTVFLMVVISPIVFLMFYKFRRHKH